MGAKERRAYTCEARIHPASSRRGVFPDGGLLHLYTRKKPAGGEANSDAVELISDYFNVPKCSVSIVRGDRSKVKLFRIWGYFELEKEKSKFLKTSARP
jgi:uncharacterized protein YggU (UPF0235/DUF167 family)